MKNNINKTTLFEIHKELNAHIVDFHGTMLPMFYSSIQEEHHAVRNNAGIFDVSHMGNIILHSEDRETAINFFNYLLPNNFTKIYPGKAIYSTMLNEKGTVIDDIIVMCINENEYHIIVNAANINKDFDWISSQMTNNIQIQNQSSNYSIIAVQGPKAHFILSNELNFDIEQMKPFTLIKTEYNACEIIISKTGYTGEEGFEIITPNQNACLLFQNILDNGKKYHLLPCGLGARDTLRLEAALPLYGQELDNDHNPLQTNIAWSVKLQKETPFIGQEALLELQKTAQPVLSGFETVGRSIPRTGMQILNDDKHPIGYVTSGTYSPTLNKNIGIAYIQKEYLQEKQLFIQIRNRIDTIHLTEIPFYKKMKK